MGQALLNLILNAAEAMPDGGNLIIRTSFEETTESPPSVRVQVEDTGQGMREEDRDKAFASLLNTTKPGGTGLGLAIVGRIIDAHQGCIKVDSAPGRGNSKAGLI